MIPAYFRIDFFFKRNCMVLLGAKGVVVSEILTEQDRSKMTNRRVYSKSSLMTDRIFLFLQIWITGRPLLFALIFLEIVSIVFPKERLFK